MLTRQTKTSDSVMTILRTLAQKAPDLKEAARVYQVILPLIQGHTRLGEPVAMTPSEARIKLQNGSPLLEGEELAFDEWAARELLIQLARGLESVKSRSEMTAHWLWVRADRRRRPRNQEPEEDDDGDWLRATSARQIRLLLERGELDASTVLARVAANDYSFIFGLTEDLHLDASLLWTLGRYALVPALYEWREQLAPMASSVAWEKDSCFVCGANVSLGELRGDQQSKHLRCIRCGADWSVPRISCVHCGNQDHRTLSFLYPEGLRDQYRVQVCDNCKRHLKLIASYEPMSPELLIVQDISTIHLDMIAQRNGYK